MQLKPFKAIVSKSSVYVALVGLSFLAIGPFLWLLSTALKGPGENIFAYPPRWMPAVFSPENFAAVWQAVPMGQYLLNSLGVTALTVLLNLLISVLAAYPLARMSFCGKDSMLYLILATMMIPFQVILIPLYLMMLQFGMTDQGDTYHWLPTWLGLAIPFAVSGFGVFFVRQAMVSLPRELEESARMDGCNSLQTLLQVLLPLIAPTLATLAVFTFMTSWGEFLWPSLVLTDPQHYTLPVGLVHLQGTFSSNWRLIAAGTLIGMVPMLVFFVLLQRYFTSGLLSGSVKG